jgi:Protein of unknown function (DUF2854)
MLTRIPLALFGLCFGGVLTLVGFYAYATGNSTLNLGGFFYGIPILLGGLALKASELKPVPFSQPTSPEILNLREQQATEIQNQLRKDVNRYRYGQEAHLDEVLAKLGLSPMDDERPVLKAIQETQTDGAYTFVMEFYSPFISLEKWQERREKIEKFFGPQIKAAIAQPQENKIDLSLIKVAEA